MYGKKQTGITLAPISECLDSIIYPCRLLSSIPLRTSGFTWIITTAIETGYDAKETTPCHRGKTTHTHVRKLIIAHSFVPSRPGRGLILRIIFLEADAQLCQDHCEQGKGKDVSRSVDTTTDKIRRGRLHVRIVAKVY